MSLCVTSTPFLETSSDSDSITSPGSLFQYLTSLSDKYFQVFGIIFVAETTAQIPVRFPFWYNSQCCLMVHRKYPTLEKILNYQYALQSIHLSALQPFYYHYSLSEWIL